MGLRSAGIAEDDVRAMFRLIGRIQTLPGEPLARWRRLLEGLCELVHADIGIKTRIAVELPDRAGAVSSIVEYGTLTADEREDLLRCFEMRQIGAVHDQRGKGGSRWSGTWYDDEDQALDSDHQLIGVCQAPQRGYFYGIGLRRQPNRPAFETRDQQLVDLFYSELAWLYHSKLALPFDGSGAALSPRLSQTLERLIVGDSEKQVAFTLGLSRHTVHGYIKEIYRHFGVSSRAQLLAHCLVPDVDV